jgi:predicted RNA methylase
MKFLSIVFLSMWMFFALGCRDSQATKIDSENATNLAEEDVLENYHDEDEIHSNVGRAIWQKPGLVIEKLGDISDKTIADIGAGTGYFSLRLSKKAKKVIAIEIEPTLINYIDSSKVSLPDSLKSRLETRLALPDNPKLAKDEVDIVLIINTVAYIEDLPKYLNTLKQGLKKGGKVMIIDYKMKRLPINAPPKSERVYLDVIEDMMVDAGYEVIQTDDTSLDFQYIIQAIKI